jgi:hypothetical protein
MLYYPRALHDLAEADDGQTTSAPPFSASFNDYAEELLQSLKNTFARLSQNMKWQPGEHVRLVFHAFNPLKEVEEKTVKGLIASLGDYDVEFAFLHVVEDHPLLLFDKAQRGVPAYDGSVPEFPKGSTIPCASIVGRDSRNGFSKCVNNLHREGVPLRCPQ